MPAPAYIEQLMAWVQSNIDNEQVLPSKIGMLQRRYVIYEETVFLTMYRCPIPKVIPRSCASDL